MDSKIKETLEKQLQLLSERSKDALPVELPGISHAMVEIVILLSEPKAQQGGKISLPEAREIASRVKKYDERMKVRQSSGSADSSDSSFLDQ